MLTNEEFIKRAKKKHGEKYDYSETTYTKSRFKVKIICLKHGIFEQTAADHLRGCGCDKCGGTFSYSNEDFIEMCKKIHGDTYNYSQVEYVNNNEKVIIICKKHGKFKQTANNHLNGQKCLKCYHDSKIIGTEEFIKRSKLVHGNKYDYSKTKYKRNDKQVVITCLIHGDFNQLPFHHMYYAHGCRYCKFSKGEEKISNWLIKNKISFQEQFKFNDCKNKTGFKLIFDFVVGSNLAIEYQGPHHYKPICFGGITEEKAKDVYLKCAKRDKIKKKYCKDNGIKLLTISYKRFSSIENILEVFFKKEE